VLLQVLMPHRTPYRPIQMTVPETPSPEVLAAQQAALAKKAAGPGRHVSDTTPSKGRMAKTQRMDDAGSSECSKLRIFCAAVTASLFHVATQKPSPCNAACSSSHCHHIACSCCCHD
jgi:hypothetical protein